MEPIVESLEAIVGTENLIAGDRLDDYAHDATFINSRPIAAVLPADTSEVAAVVRTCAENRVAITARGSGTGLVGGPVAISGGIVLSLERMRRLEIDELNFCAVAGPGVITHDLQLAAEAVGLMYPPDPASSEMSSIGGNVACNSGGLSSLKYGLTADYVLGGTVVLANGRVLSLGGRTRKRSSGYRLMSLFVGSEGTLGIITEVILKLIPLPRYRATAMVGYRTIDEAAAAVGRTLRNGYFPRALELMDRAALDLVAHLLPKGFDLDLGAVLIVEQDGSEPARVQEDLEGIVVCMGGVDNRLAQSEAEQEGIWLARRGFGKRLMEMRQNYFPEDISVPIAAIPEAVRRFSELSRTTGMTIATVGHAGDGNLHPVILFDDNQRHLVGPAAASIFRDAVELGGSISGEHGLGLLKRDHARAEHGADAIELMRQLKSLLDPDGILNPHKVLPEAPASDEFLDDMPGWGIERPSGRHRPELGS